MMNKIITFMWQYIIATFFLSPLIVAAEITIDTHISGEVITINGLSASEKHELLKNPKQAYLQLEENLPAPGMPLSLELKEGLLLLKPMFAIIKGKPYKLSLQLSGGYLVERDILVEGDKSTTPRFISFYPNSTSLPENILRLYLNFSEPMARGQVVDKIKLSDGSGRRIINPFLNLKTELWNESQTRLTLLLDPGRLKQGVGPNIKTGTPLKAGRSYYLQISDEFASALGQPLSEEKFIHFIVSKPERRKISSQDWDIQVPENNTLSPLVISFDRLMDTGATLRFLRVFDHKGNAIKGSALTDGKTWSFTPKNHWKTLQYSVVISPQLEDVSGNTIIAPFDAPNGTMKITQSRPIFLTFKPLYK